MVILVHRALRGALPGTFVVYVLWVCSFFGQPVCGGCVNPVLAPQILYERLKVPPAINQFKRTLDKNQGAFARAAAARPGGGGGGGGGEKRHWPVGG